MYETEQHGSKRRGGDPQKTDQKRLRKKTRRSAGDRPEEIQKKTRKGSRETEERIKKSIRKNARYMAERIKI